MSTDVAALARPDIRELEAYVPASYAPGLVRLNANEAPWRSSADATERGLNRYPEARPSALTHTLAEHYGVPSDTLFVTRGTSEAIDLLIRCFCRPGQDEIVICPPTFGMYAVYANIQAAGIREIPLEDGFTLPVDAILAAWRDTSRLVFVTTPNNPTGNAFDARDIERLAKGLTGRGIVVIDGAYLEFADTDAAMALRRYDNVVVLRTMSKAYGLAGARCGSLIAHPTVIELVTKVMPPYAVPTPSVESALVALASEQFEVMPERINALIHERARVAAALGDLPITVRVLPSDANFLLTQFRSPQRVLDAAADAGLLLRDFSKQAATQDCLRITIGTTAQNDALIAALTELTP
ncbi:MAG: histidinol-phosphate transaminase [Pseudomonadota bacterium]